MGPVRENYSEIRQKRADLLSDWNKEKLGDAMEALDHHTKKETKLEKRERLLNELYTSEEKYIEGMSIALSKFRTEINDPNSCVKRPPDLSPEKEHLIFKNMQAIYEWHRE
jgi:hypothetical protein